MREVVLEGRALPIFPCRDKKPICENGFYDATVDPVAIAALWQKYRGPQIGVATGAVSGIDVLDIDPRKGGDRWFHENRTRLPLTRVHETPSGGQHLIFRHSPGLRCSNSKIARGIDIKADGGYVIWWPAACCRVLVEGPIAELPQLLLLSSTSAVSLPAGGEAGGSLASVAPSRQALNAELPASSTNGEGFSLSLTGTTKRANPLPSKTLDPKRRIRSILRLVEHAEEGTRNGLVWWGACRSGEMIFEQHLTHDEAEQNLVNAAEVCGYVRDHGLENTMQVIRRGLQRGFDDLRATSGSLDDDVQGPAA